MLVRWFCNGSSGPESLKPASGGQGEVFLHQVHLR